MKYHQLDATKKRASDYRSDLVSGVFMHAGNHRLYRVNEIVWNGDTDTWMVSHSRSETDVNFVRSLDNFLGNREDGAPRFIRTAEGD